ncbi:uncharacterized protein METZ01_LOCUS463228 [marine metagenome]|uniref:Thioredoxin domain-containing protein n=1 Tax=marine metagenome TaxID=408172 RepID=A0A383ARR4_9ZZZZ
MHSGLRNRRLTITTFISVLLGLLVASMVILRSKTTEEMQQIGLYRFDQPREISEFSMVDHLGDEVGLSAFRGKWTLVFFGFTTCPDICPTTLGVLSEAVLDLHKPPQVIMVTVDQERDTPERLRNYVPAFHPDFRGFVGSFDETARLAEQLNVAFSKTPGDQPGTYLMAHTPSIILIDPEARYAGFIKAPHRVQHIQWLLQSF